MKKGFTLIELIAVVAILGLIATIAGISYTTINNNHKKDSCKNLQKQLENTAIEYAQDKNLLHNNSLASITYKNLVDAGYLEADLENPVNKEKINPNYSITVKYSSDNYSIDSNSSKLGCE